MQSDSKRACRLWGDPDVTTTMAGLEADPWSDHRVWFDHNMGWWGYAGMGAGMVLFWALVVAGIVALVVLCPATGRSSSRRRLRSRYWPRRFVRGEISETEYRDRLAVLRDPARH